VKKNYETLSFIRCHERDSAEIVAIPVPNVKQVGAADSKSESQFIAGIAVFWLTGPKKHD